MMDELFDRITKTLNELIHLIQDLREEIEDTAVEPGEVDSIGSIFHEPLKHQQLMIPTMEQKSI